MRILYIYKYAILGGVTTQLANRLAYLKDKLEVHFLFIEDYGGIKTLQNHSFIKVTSEIREIARYIDSIGFDYVIVIDTLEAYEALKLCNSQPKVISEVHTTTTNLKYLEKLKHNLPMQMFITPSHYLKNCIDNVYGFNEKIESYVVSNCLNTELFKPQETKKTENKNIILWIGKLDDHKNWRGFLDVCDRLKHINKLEFWVIGGYTAPDYVVNDLVKTLQNLNLMDKVKWYSKVRYDMMPYIYNYVASSGGLTVSTSINESFGMTAIEALACKCPLLMPKVGALSEVLDGELSQFLYQEIDELYEKINIILGEKELHKINTLLARGYKKVNDVYSIKNVGEKYLEILKEKV